MPRPTLWHRDRTAQEKRDILRDYCDGVWDGIRAVCEIPLTEVYNLLIPRKCCVDLSRDILRFERNTTMAIATCSCHSRASAHVVRASLHSR